MGLYTANARRPTVDSRCHVVCVCVCVCVCVSLSMLSVIVSFVQNCAVRKYSGLCVHVPCWVGWSRVQCPSRHNMGHLGGGESVRVVVVSSACWSEHLVTTARRHGGSVCSINVRSHHSLTTARASMSTGRTSSVRTVR